MKIFSFLIFYILLLAKISCEFSDCSLPNINSESSIPVQDNNKLNALNILLPFISENINLRSISYKIISTAGCYK